MKRPALVVVTIALMLPTIACSGACRGSKESMAPSAASHGQQPGPQAHQPGPQGAKAARSPESDANQLLERQAIIDSKLTSDIK